MEYSFKTYQINTIPDESSSRFYTVIYGITEEGEIYEKVVQGANSTSDWRRIDNLPFPKLRKPKELE
jgi:hypothetical protein